MGPFLFMNQTLKELEEKAKRLTPDQELEMYAPYSKYLTLLEAAIKEKRSVKHVSGGFELKFGKVPVMIRPTKLDPLAHLEGLSDQVSHPLP